MAKYIVKGGMHPRDGKRYMPGDVVTIPDTEKPHPEWLPYKGKAARDAESGDDEGVDQEEGVDEAPPEPEKKPARGGKAKKDAADAKKAEESA